MYYILYKIDISEVSNFTETRLETEDTTFVNIVETYRHQLSLGRADKIPFSSKFLSKKYPEIRASYLNNMRHRKNQNNVKGAERMYETVLSVYEFRSRGDYALREMDKKVERMLNDAGGVQPARSRGRDFCREMERGYRAFLVQCLRSR